MSTLLLNADAAPISWLPLSVISWQDSIKYLVLDKANVLEWHEDWVVRSVNWETKVPAVMMLKNYEKRKTGIRFSKQNVFLRDLYICQYCGEDDISKKNLTVDHVLPISHGGKSTYENCVTACGSCNSLKGNNKKIVPKTKPFKPSYYQLVENRKKIGINYQHPSWKNYL